MAARVGSEARDKVMLLVSTLRRRMKRGIPRFLDKIRAQSRTVSQGFGNE
jgi:hypothetical protein